MTELLDFSKSLALLEEAAETTPNAGHSARRATWHAPVCVESGQGGYVTTVEGHRMPEFQAGAGAHLFGHLDPDLVAAKVEAVTTRTLAGIGTTRYEIELAKLFRKHVREAEQSLFCSSGTEALQGMVRAMRAITGRRKVIKAQGNYHGTNDVFWLNCQSAPEMIGRTDPHAAGMLEDTYKHTLVVRYNDLDDLREQIDAHPGDVAGIILEPYGHNCAGMSPAPGYLRAVRELCDEHDILFGLDKVITGLRHGIDGMRGLDADDVVPDFSAFGKAAGGGEAFAALCGLKQHMRIFDVRNGGTVPWNGTHNAHPTGVAAGIATFCKIERIGIEAFYTRLFALGDRMRDGLREIIARLGIEATVCGHGSVFALLVAPTASPTGARNYDENAANDDEKLIAFLTGMVRRGVLFFPDRDGWRCCVSYAHEESDIDYVLQVAEASMRETWGLAA